MLYSTIKNAAKLIEMKKTALIWKKQESEIPLPFRAWVMHAGSFMQRLVQQGVNDAHVQVLRQRWMCPKLEERQLLGIEKGVHALVREVLILSEQSQWMFARTVIPRSTLTGEEQQLAHLNNRPLGSVLFKDPTMKRGEFEIACLQPGEQWHAKISEVTGLLLPDLWARRSLFTLQGKSLLLAEVFLPDIATLGPANK